MSECEGLTAEQWKEKYEADIAVEIAERDKWAKKADELRGERDRWKNSAEMRKNAYAELFEKEFERANAAKRNHNQRREITRLLELRRKCPQCSAARDRRKEDPA